MPARRRVVLRAFAVNLLLLLRSVRRADHLLSRDRAMTNARLTHLLPLLVIAAFLPACDGGKDTQEKAAKDTVAAFKEFNDVLDDVTDESSASAAAPKINDVAKKIKAIAERMKSLPTPT